MSYSNNQRSILAGTGITVTPGPATGTGAESVTISASGSPILPIRNAIISPVVVLSTDDVISVQVPAGAVAVTLPALPATGATVTIKDGLGNASVATPITITPAAGTIDGAATAVINVAYGSLTLVYNGTQWLIL